MTKPVVTTPEADLHILETDAWWRVDRDNAPNLFEDELALVLGMIGAAPGVGKRYPHTDATIRRVLMRATRNHVYYVEWDDRVVVVAVWGAVKGSGPDLAGL